MQSVKNKKILYIAPHRKGRSPGQRFRFEQFMPFLQENGWSITYSNIVSAKDDAILYTKGRYLLKFLLSVKWMFMRIADLLKARKFDVIIIYREAIFFGNTFFERRLKKSGVPIVFDFDDAIWLNDISEENKNLRWLKNPAKTSRIISLSDLTIVGNQFLSDYATQYSKNVTIIPTCVNPEYHKPIPTKPNNTICIGWTGSSTTLKHFETIIPVLIKIKQKYAEKVSFKVIVDKEYSVSELGLESVVWSKEVEVEELNKIDIGIMPLPNDKWSMGKCGFKGLQYMSLQKPTVMSPVGVNTDIITNGENGFLADTDDEWFDILCKLINSAELRDKIGKAGRETILNKYSLQIQQTALLDKLNSLV